MNKFVILNVVILASFHLSIASSDIPKFDCHPDHGPTKSRCVARGCHWNPPTMANQGPPCRRRNILNWYRLERRLFDGTCVLQKRSTSSWFGRSETKLYAGIETTNSFLRLTINKNPVSSVHSENSPLTFRLSESPKQYKDMFAWSINRNVGDRPKQMLLSSPSFPTLEYSDQFIQVSLKLPTKIFFGIGEQYHTSLKRKFEWEKLSLFTRDHEPVLGWENQNVYGFQPMGMGLDETGNAFGVFFNNTYGMNVQFHPDPLMMTFRAMGGPIDIYVFPGPRPDDVVQQLTSVIGRPFLPPYWSLGYNLCRYGYRNLSELETVWDRNRAAGIPQDVQFIDIDYMDGEKDFTFSPSRFKELPRLVKKIHDSGRKLILIFDPAISSKASNYSPLLNGLKAGVFMKDNRTGKPFEAKCWPGKAYWPDFTNPSSVQYWTTECKNFHKVIAFDGIWLDMNDPSNFISGSLSGCANNSLNHPPFNPLNYGPVFDNTLCLDAVQHLGYHYQWHNFYGHSEAQTTNEALRQVFPGKRPFILTRSTSPGTGVHAAHWTGDNSASWEQMNHTLITNLEFAIFGIPMVGSDICGFNHDTNEELCLRWSQLGAFYPYSRNHNDASAKVDQDPAAWSPNTTQAIKNVLLMRYALLPHLYTLLARAHIKGSTVMRPLFFEFPHDQNVHNIHQQFLWGSSLMIIPVLKPFTEKINAYYPSLTNCAERGQRDKEGPKVLCSLHSLSRLVTGSDSEDGCVTVSRDTAQKIILCWQQTKILLSLVVEFDVMRTD